MRKQKRRYCVKRHSRFRWVILFSSHPFRLNAIGGVESFQEGGVFFFKKLRSGAIGDFNRCALVKANDGRGEVISPCEAVIDAGAPITAAPLQVTFKALRIALLFHLGELLADIRIQTLENIAHQAQVCIILSHHALAGVNVAAGSDGDFLGAEIAAIAKFIAPFQMGGDLSGNETQMQRLAAPERFQIASCGMFIAVAPELAVPLRPGGEEVGI